MDAPHEASGATPASRASAPLLVYRERAPSEALAPWVTRFYELRAASTDEPPGSVVLDGRDPLLRRLLPNPDANLLFDLGEPGSFACAALRDTRTERRSGARGRTLAQGVFPHPAHARFGPSVALFGVAFAVGRARPFLPVAAVRMAGRILPLAELGADALRPVEALSAATSFDERVEVITSLLERRAPTGSPRDEPLRAILAEIRAHAGTVRVATMASGCGLTRQRFTRWFTGAVGMGPKAFARLTRLHALLDRASPGGVESWSRVAVELGWYDQAHMIADFRWMTGLPPGRFLAERAALQRV